jgi:acylphosphatase
MTIVNIGGFMERAVITVRGRIQKVGYRDFVTDLANEQDITGVVENLPDGKSVEIIAEAEKDILDEFIQHIWAKDDPMVKVTKIDTAFQPATGDYEFFDITYDDFQNEAFERIGEAAIYLKRLNNGQTMMLEKQDMMLGKQDMMLEKQDIVVDKLDETRQDIVREIKETRGDIRSDLNTRFMNIENDIVEIRAKIG